MQAIKKGWKALGLLLGALIRVALVIGSIYAVVIVFFLLVGN